MQKAQGAFELAQTEVTQAQAGMELLMKEARLPVVSSLSDRRTCGQNLATLSWDHGGHVEPDAGPPLDNLVSAINESKLLVQSSAGRLMQEGEEQSDAEKDGDFSDLQHQQVCDDELADFEAMRGLGAARPRRVVRPGAAK